MKGEKVLDCSFWVLSEGGKCQFFVSVEDAWRAYTKDVDSFLAKLRSSSAMLENGRELLGYEMLPLYVAPEYSGLCFNELAVTARPPIYLRRTETLPVKENFNEDWLLYVDIVSDSRLILEREGNEIVLRGNLLEEGISLPLTEGGSFGETRSLLNSRGHEIRLITGEREIFPGGGMAKRLTAEQEVRAFLLVKLAKGIRLRDVGCRWG